MTFTEMTGALGIDTYPDALPSIFENEREPIDLSAEALRRIEEEYGTMGERLSDLIACAEAVKENEALTEYTRCAVKFLERCNHTEGFKLRIPALDQDSPLYHYQILLLSLALPNGFATYKKRGFPDEEIRPMMKAVCGRINVKNKTTGKYDNSSYNWLRHYAHALLFSSKLFGVTPRPIDAPVIFLKSCNGEYKILATGGRYHRDGKPLGNACYTDPEGAFDAQFSEDGEFYTGHEIVNAFVRKDTVSLKKSEWRVIARQWDWMVGLHIPRGADLSEESMTAGFKDAMAKTLRHYADLDPKFVHTSTWLLSPKLAELQGEGSGIKRFSDRFIKYPIKSGGKELFGFAFPSCPNDYNDLPEGTSLQRKLKALYLSGGCIHAHAGFVPGSEEWK